MVLNIGGSGHRATYASGSGTRYLNFEYTVQAADFDSDGISLCSDTFLDRGCGRISLNGGSISAQSDSLAVELDVPALGNQSGHKVDATPVFVPNPGVGPMPSPSMGTVPRNWSLRPVDVDFGEQFRVLFVTSARNAISSGRSTTTTSMRSMTQGRATPQSGRTRTASGSSPAPRLWMRGTTLGSPEPG